MTSRSSALGLIATPLAAFLATGAATAGASRTSYTLIAAKSSLTYTFVQAGGMNEGSFKSFSVSFDPTGGRLSVVIDMRSFDTGDAQRDGILGGRDMFDVAQYPEAQFASTRIQKTPTGFTAVGLLTIRGITRPAAVPFTWRTAAGPDGRIGSLSGETTIHRLDYEIGQGQWKSTEWVGNDVTVRYSLQLEMR